MKLLQWLWGERRHRSIHQCLSLISRVWDAENGELLCAPLQGHTDDVLSVAVSPDSNLIVSGSADKTIRAWDATTGQAFCGPFEEHSVRSIAISISLGGIIVSGSDDKTIRV